MSRETDIDRVKQVLQGVKNEALLQGHARLKPIHVLASDLGDDSKLLIDLAKGEIAIKRQKQLVY